LQSNYKKIKNNSCTLGAGVLGLPFILKEIGLALGLVSIGIGAILAIISLLYLHESHKIMSLSTDYDGKDYEDLGYFCFGSVCSFLVKICVILINLGACTSYMIIICDTIQPIMEYITDYYLVNEKWFIALIVILPLFVISLYRRMSDLKVISYVSVMAVVVFLIFIVVSFRHQLNRNERSGKIVYFQLNFSMLRVLGTIGNI
jgi:amino acid permease